MEYFTYEACKQFVVYTLAGLIIFTAAAWYCHVLIDLMIKFVKALRHLFKFLKDKIQAHEAKEKHE